MRSELNCLPEEAATSVPPYWLASHVHLCVVRGQVVICDLRRNQYSVVLSAAQLAGMVRGWPISSAPDQPHGNLGARAIQQLVADGVLTTDPALGKETSLAAAVMPTRELVSMPLDYRPRVRLLDALAVARAWVSARIARRRHSMESLVQRVRDRKENAGCRGAPWPRRRARELVQAFLWTRPLFYASRNACLIDSLVLVELLAAHGIFPAWIFGVKVEPFAAHCWVQHERFVLNDSAAYVRGFTPILSV